MTNEAAPVGFTEQLLARYTRAGLPSFGPLPEVVVSVAYAIGAALLLRADGRALAGVLIVLIAWRGGMASVLAAREGVSPWRRATVAAINPTVEGLVLVGAAFWARDQQDVPGPLALGMLAFGGVLLLSYARIRIRASAGEELPDGPSGIAAREVRLVVLALGVLIGQVYLALVIIAALTHLVVIGHLVRLRTTLRDS